MTGPCVFAFEPPPLVALVAAESEVFDPEPEAQDDESAASPVDEVVDVGAVGSFAVVVVVVVVGSGVFVGLGVVVAASLESVAAGVFDPCSVVVVVGTAVVVVVVVVVVELVVVVVELVVVVDDVVVDDVVVVDEGLPAGLPAEAPGHCRVEAEAAADGSEPVAAVSPKTTVEAAASAPKIVRNRRVIGAWREPTGC